MIAQNRMMKADILVIDDTPENLRLLSLLLSQQGYQVRKALDGQSALTAVKILPPDLILLDIMMPGIDGYEVCHCLKSDPHTAEIPIIFLSALNDAFDKVKAFKSGGADYLTKPFQLEEVLMRVQHQLALRAGVQQISQLNIQLEERVKERTHQLELVNQELCREIDERKRAEAQLLEMALYDALTQLPNRTLFLERLQQSIDQASIDSGYQFAVLFLDCDRFKVINDSLGHLAGDELLVEVAHRLQTCIRKTDTLARLGGDEFTVLLTQTDTIDQAVQVAEQILKVLSHPFVLREREVFISASIGIVPVQTGNHLDQEKPQHLLPEHLLRDADAAMYRAKAAGRNQYAVFNTAMHTAALSHLHLEHDLHRAIVQQEFVLHYQPIVALDTGTISGFEALVRWQHPEHGLVYPDKFIPLAEELGLISALGRWVMQVACQQLRQWQQQGCAKPSLTMSVNLSVWQFFQPDLIEQIDQILTESQLSPTNLTLEITESAIMDNTTAASTVLQKLHERQIHLSLDDFGTGYSSLSCLHLFPVNTLKIDRSFVQQLEEGEKNSALISAIASIAHALNMKVVAEGIETDQQLAYLRSLNCGFGQGFWFSRPIIAEQAATLLSSNPHW